MTQVYIIISVVAVIFLLVCYVFMRQTLIDRHKEKQRFHNILEKRARDLLQMISVFPAGFLHQELQIFVYRCIMHSYEQLAKLEPANTEYVEALKIHSAQIDTIIRTPENRSPVSMQSPAQVNEVRQYLNLLGEFLDKSLRINNITQKQYSHYRATLKGLTLNITIDGYLLSAKQAAEGDKYKLGIHYYELAKGLLVKESPDNAKEQIQRIDVEIESLNQREAEQNAELDSAKTKRATSEDGPENCEWKEFGQEDEGWKKKNVYD